MLSGELPWKNSQESVGRPHSHVTVDDLFSPESSIAALGTVIAATLPVAAASSSVPA